VIDETPLRVFYSQSFSWPVLQSVLNHSNFLISDRGHGSFLGYVLAQQPIEIFIAAAFPNGKRSGKVSRALKLFINLGMRCKLFAVVEGQCLDSFVQGLEVTHDG
jgi:hypothetical protein